MVFICSFSVVKTACICMLSFSCTYIAWCTLVQVASDAFARPAFAEEKSLILLEELDVQVELDTSLMAPLAKLIGRSKVDKYPSLSLSLLCVPLLLMMRHMHLLPALKGFCGALTTAYCLSVHALLATCHDQFALPCSNIPENMRDHR